MQWFLFWFSSKSINFFSSWKKLILFFNSDYDCRKVTAIQKIVHTLRKYKQQTKKKTQWKRNAFNFILAGLTMKKWKIQNNKIYELFLFCCERRLIIIVRFHLKDRVEELWWLNRCHLIFFSLNFSLGVSVSIHRNHKAQQHSWVHPYLSLSLSLSLTHTHTHTHTHTYNFSLTHNVLCLL